MQLRESLFDGYSADQACREKAVDVALQQARSANLNVQAGVRRGAGRVDSLIDGDGIQPVSVSLLLFFRGGAEGATTRTPFEVVRHIFFQMTYEIDETKVFNR